jgi:soluble lytic murein transglycosylase-like protein
MRRAAAVGLAAAGATVVAGALGAALLAGAFGTGPMAAPNEVPAEFRSLVRDAAARCPQVPLRVFAAQIAQESSWDPRAESPAGAQGIAQFTPQTWADYGLDGDGDGRKDVWNPADALPAAATLNCRNRRYVAAVEGNRLELTLAAYNAGATAVLRYGGVPPFPETRGYVARILERSRDIVI